MKRHQRRCPIDSPDPFQLFLISLFCSVQKFSFIMTFLIRKSVICGPSPLLPKLSALLPEVWRLPSPHKSHSWVGLEKGKASQTVPGDPAWTQEMTQDGGGRNQLETGLTQTREAQGRKSLFRETKQGILKKSRVKMSKEAW